MAAKTQIKDVDHGYKRLMAAVNAAGATALLGVQGQLAAEQHTDSVKTVGEIAAEAELGLGQPERSWLRAWMDIHEKQIEQDLRAAMKQILLGRLTSDQALGILGAKYVGSIQERIVAGITPPNAPSTIARKHSSTPLIDTGQFKSAITWVLEKALAARSAATGG